MSIIRLLAGLTSAFLLSAFIMPQIRRLAWRAGLVATHGKDRIHRVPVALLGGIGVIVAFACALYFTSEVVWWVPGALALCAVGFLDDIVAMHPRTKLLCEVPFAIFASAWIHIPPLLPWSWLQQLAIGFGSLSPVPCGHRSQIARSGVYPSGDQGDESGCALCLFVSAQSSPSVRWNRVSAPPTEMTRKPDRMRLEVLNLAETVLFGSQNVLH